MGYKNIYLFQMHRKRSPNLSKSLVKSSVEKLHSGGGGGGSGARGRRGEGVSFKAKKKGNSDDKGESGSAETPENGGYNARCLIRLTRWYLLHY